MWTKNEAQFWICLALYQEYVEVHVSRLFQLIMSPGQQFNKRIF